MITNAQLTEDATVKDSSSLMQDDQNDQYLTFLMADEEYGVDILSVQEIRGWESVTPIPNAPSHIKGVINLRGIIVPIIDLRQRFGLSQVEYGPLTVVIVLKVNSDNGDRVMGIVVDAVSDVYALANHEMRAAPDLGNHVDTAYIKGLVNVEKKMIILLEINELLGKGAIPEIDLPTLKQLTNDAQ